MLRSTGVAVFRSPFHFFYCQTYRGGLSIYRKFRVKISTRSAYLFGLRLSGAITFSHCCPLSFCSLPGVYPVGSFSAFRPGVFLLWNRGTSCRKFRHCSHLLWDVERLRLLMLRANPPEPGNCRNPHSAQPRPAYRLL